MKYAHFLITRFNLPKLWVKDRHGVSTQTEEWLEQRFDLFEKYCLPSIAAQTSKNFVWLLLFWDKTPEKYKKLNEDLQAKYPFCKPCYLDEQQTKDFAAYCSKIINSMTAADTDCVITTRLDNDDSFAVDTMEYLESFTEKLQDKGPCFISLLHGIQYYPKFNISVVVTDWETNHFLSYVEPFTPDLKTVYCNDHTKILQHHTVKFAGREKEMWLEICHERNVGNAPHIWWTFKPLKHGFDTNRFKLAVPPSPLRSNRLKFRLFYVVPVALSRGLKHRVFNKVCRLFK